MRFQGRPYEIIRPVYVWNRYKSQAGAVVLSFFFKLRHGSAADFRSGLSFQGDFRTGPLFVELIFERAFFRADFRTGLFRAYKPTST